ncbi:MAG: hypothetical protein JAZ13_08235 [Candidatus Thiodiazotropha taylori]|nr:hypothetical protein [Candidatus Thiodiazotropha taylori]
MHLEHAWFEFTQSHLDKFSLQMLRTHPNNDITYEGDSRYQKLTDWLPSSWEGRQQKLDYIISVERAHLLDELYSGRLWAIGFVTESDGFDRPTRVPRDLFFVNPNDYPERQPQIDWEKGELIGCGVSYFDIHVLRPIGQVEADSVKNDDQSLNTEEQRASPIKSTRGRPSTGNEIRNMVIKMWKDPEFKKISNRTTQAREVRAKLCGEETRNIDNLVGYNTSTIVRIIGEVAGQRSE